MCLQTKSTLPKILFFLARLSTCALTALSRNLNIFCEPIRVERMKRSNSSTMKLTKEEEILLEQYGRTPSNKSKKLIYGNALLVASAPICKIGVPSVRRFSFP